MILIKEIKIPPNSYLCDNAITWCVNCCYLWLQAMWIVYEICGLITGCASCCAKCHFLPFLPFSSISQPPSWKMLPVAKTPENSTFPLYSPILPAYDTKRSHFRHYRTKIREWRIRIDGAKKWICSTPRITHIAFFGNHHSLHYSKHHLPQHSKSYLLSFT